MSDVVAAIQSACAAAGISQRDLAEKTGISQSTLSRTLAGRRAPKLPELVLIADATGCTVAQLTGKSRADRVECAARGVDGASMDKMRQRLIHFIELDAYLDDYAI
ncbi:MAG: helix-turn-helix transcriptional regulator [Actinomycetaceae bacterium]|nr:helix-turn-helix transcriptional regulator [Actinomycetaceae bacterium]MDU0969870.1 helix-turn-helix transcriptional regulator [Actinomycetaceae bacterium]